jgi:uncharacterized protein (DUF488 family)
MDPCKAYAFYTIGHGTRPLGDFINLLQSVEVTLVADIRTVPRSHTNPQYNRDVLPEALEQYKIRYEHIAALGGRRGKKRDVPPSVNAFWQNESFHNYADYAMGESFRGGLARLQELGHARRCVVMCAETVWWRCHRRIIADYLIARRRNGVPYPWARAHRACTHDRRGATASLWNTDLFRRPLNADAKTNPTGTQSGSVLIAMPGSIRSSCNSLKIFLARGNHFELSDG